MVGGLGEGNGGKGVEGKETGQQGRAGGRGLGLGLLSGKGREEEVEK